MRRNVENTNGLGQATHKEILEVRKCLAQIQSKIESLSQKIDSATFQTVMQSADISEFFPVENNEQLENFMDRANPEWPSRRSGFYNLLLSIASDTKKGFARGMIKALFTRPYICTVKWQPTG